MCAIPLSQMWQLRNSHPASTSNGWTVAQPSSLFQNQRVVSGSACFNRLLAPFRIAGFLTDKRHRVHFDEADLEIEVALGIPETELGWICPPSRSIWTTVVRRIRQKGLATRRMTFAIGGTPF